MSSDESPLCDVSSRLLAKMLCWRKEDESHSSNVLLHSRLLSQHDGPSRLSPARRHYPLQQQQPSVSDVTLEQRCTDEYHAPLCLQQQPVTDKSSQNIAHSRKRASAVPSQQKDAAYYEKRRKNNESAKKSREARQHKEQVIVAHVQLLKEENMRLKAEHKLLNRQSGELLARLYSRSSEHKN